MMVLGAADTLALPAFVISIIAALTALASLTWHVVEWTWSGPDVRLRTHDSEAGSWLAENWPG